MPTFKNEIAPDLSQAAISASGMAVDVSLQQQQPQLEKSRESLEERIERLEERIESLTKALNRSNESRLHNKVNELQEELCQRRFELYVAQLHLSAVRSQLQLFEYNFRPASVVIAGAAAAAAAAAVATSGSNDPIDVQGVDFDPTMLPGSAGALAGGSSMASSTTSLGSQSHSRKSPIGSTPLGYRNKWLKALKSLRETPSQQSDASLQQAQQSSVQNQLR